MPSLWPTPPVKLTVPFHLASAAKRGGSQPEENNNYHYYNGMLCNPCIQALPTSSGVWVQYLKSCHIMKSYHHEIIPDLNHVRFDEVFNT